MKFLGTELRWSDPPALDQRDLSQVTDLGIAFASRMSSIVRGDETIPAVYRAIQFLTDTVAGLSLEEVERGTVNYPTPDLLSEPDPTQSDHTTKSQIMSSLLFRGNAYLAPRTFDELGFATSCIVLNPDDVSVGWDEKRIYPTYKWREQPMTANRDIYPIPLNRWPGNPAGVSPITACRLMLEGVFAEQNLAVSLMLDDATPSGAIKVPEKITKPEALKILEGWEATHSGRKRPGVLGGGSEWQPLSFSPVDAQFLESRTFSVQEIARMFGLHGMFLLVPTGDSLTYSTTEGINRFTLTTTIAPTYLARIEQAFSRMLPTGRSARFNTDELLIPDLSVRIESYGALVRAGVDPVSAAETVGLKPMVHTGLAPVTLQRPEDVESIVDPAMNGKVMSNV